MRKRDLAYAKTKAQIRCACTICVFVFAQAKILFSYDAAHNYVPPTKGGGHIVFGGDPVGVRVRVSIRIASFRHDIFWTIGWNFTKLA